MPNIVNETEDSIDYEMQDDTEDPGSRGIIISGPIPPGRTLFMNDKLLPVEIVNHVFISPKTGNELARIEKAPIEHNAFFEYICVVRSPK